jgi:cytochrome P450
MAAEVARLRIASCVIRKAEQSDVKLGDDWLIREGTSAMVFSRDVSLNNPIWSERWPRARVPLEQFSVERFPIADPRLKAKSDVDGEYRGKFNTGDANDLLIAFGAGSHVCPGRHFARAVQAATLAVLLGEYEIQLSDPEPTEQMMPPVDGDIFGTIKPLGPLRMRLRKRRTR